METWKARSETKDPKVQQKEKDARGESKAIRFLGFDFGLETHL